MLYGIVSLLTGARWDDVLSWTLPLVLGVPIFWVTSRLVKDINRIEIINRLFLAVAAFMSVCEIVEYFLPGIASLFPWFFHPLPLITTDGFVRGTFSFWGYPAGASVVVFGLLIAYDNIIRTKENGLRVISLFIFALGVVAVYVSGTRSAWIGLGLGLLLLSFSNLLKGTVPMLVMLVASTILPPVFFARTETVVAALNGNYMDSSLVSRVNRWNWSIGIIRSNPLWGIGYGHWLSHNIFLEIGSTIGLIPAVLFLIFILQLVFHIIRVALNGPTPDARRYGWLFLAFALNWIVELNVETVFQTPPLAVAFWPIFALSWYLPDLFPKFPKKDA
jgi:O-antigen ligase